MKKIVIGFLLICSSAPLFSVEIVLWHSAAGQEEETIDGLASIFNLRNDTVHVKVENVRKRGQGYTISESVADEVKKNRGPDIFIWVNDKINYWADNHIIAPITGFVADREMPEFLPSTVEAVTYKNELYGLPLSFECLILFFNKDLIKSPPLTTDDLIRSARAITDKPNRKFGLCYQNADFYFHSIWFNGFGAPLFDPVTGRPIINSRECADSLKFARRLVADENIFLLKNDIGVDEVNYDIQLKYFNEGRIGMIITGPWDIKSVSPDIDLGLAKLPFISDNNKWAEPYLGVKTIMITTSTRHPREAFAVASFFASDYAGYVLATQAGYQPANKGAYAYDEVNQNEYSIQFRNQAYNSRPLPNRREMEIVWKVMNDFRSNPDDIATIRYGVVRSATELRQPVDEVLTRFQRNADDEFKRLPGNPAGPGAKP